MPPYPIARIPKKVAPEQLNKCLNCGAELTQMRGAIYLKKCSVCDCGCIYRTIDTYYNDGLIVPCNTHWSEDCYWRNS